MIAVANPDIFEFCKHFRIKCIQFRKVKPGSNEECKISNNIEVQAT